jgi:cytochrome P450
MDQQLDLVLETIKKLATTWIGFATIALVVYVFIDYIYVIVLRNKLGAEPCTNVARDYFFGFRQAWLYLQLKMNGELTDYINREFQQAQIQTVSTCLAGKPVMLTIDPENIKAVLATQFNDFSLGIRHPQFAPLLGDGIFTLDGQGWKHSRSMLRPQFAREQVAHVKQLEPHVQTLAKHIQNANGKKFDIQDLFYRLTVDTSSEFLFGVSVDSLKDESIGYPRSSDDVAGKYEFADAFNYSQKYLSDRALLQNFYWLLNGSKFKKNNKIVQKFADYYVKRALDMSLEELEKHSENSYTFLYELAKQTRDPGIIRDQALNILVAGRDTTAGLLSFVFYELARNPQVWEKLKEEIDQNFGRGQDSRVDEITFESLKKCEYLKAVINEALRLYPSVPINFRTVTKNTTLPRGGGNNEQSPILVRKGQTVLYSVYSTHRYKPIYGEDAEEFRPERWFEESTKKLGWAYLPFNGGPRICLGQQFALTEAYYVTTRLIQMFGNIESFNEYPGKKLSHLTISLQDGCNIALS